MIPTSLRALVLSALAALPLRLFLIAGATSLGAATIVEVGEDDFRVSIMGGTGDEAFSAREPAVAYNSTDEELLVVWSANEDAPSLEAEKVEIWGQRLAVVTGELLGPRFRISFTGG